MDLGTRADWKTTYKAPVMRIIEKSPFFIDVPEDVPSALARGGVTPKDIKHVCITHIHFDHVGVPSDYPNATFYIGQGQRPLLENGYPKNQNSAFDVDLFPAERTRFISPHSDGAEVWKPLGPFPHAWDFWGDGSLYIVDAPGHMPGHLMIIARSSSDGGWIGLLADVAHDWKILNGEADIGLHSRLGCMHKDKAAAEDTMRKARELLKLPRVKVILSHDQPWYEANKGGSDFWPGRFTSP